MSKRVNRVNIEPEILHGNWFSYWKYTEVYIISLLTLLLLVKLTSSFLTIHYNVGHTVRIRYKV